MLLKNELPAYSSNSLLDIIPKEKISFVSKNPLNIMLIEKYDDCKLKNEKNDLFNNIVEKSEDFEIFDVNKKIINKKNRKKNKHGICLCSCVII